MKLRPPDLDIPLDDPFKNDALERAKLEPTLTEFVCQATGPFVLALDGGWGTGKTTFLKMWRHKLEARGCKCLYFNAWETDFAPDPLVALVSELSVALKGSRNSKKVDQLKALAGRLTRRGIPVLIRLATAGLIPGDTKTEEAIAELLGEAAEDEIKAYEENKKDLHDFREVLTEAVGKILAEGNEGAKVVIFVDELDRCRPSYAVELLERIKHLFDVQGLAFVLGVDRDQLAHSIRILYGINFDASGYLRRFIDFDYRLPPPPPGKFFKHLFAAMEIERLLRGRPGRRDWSQSNLTEILASLCERFQLSLREQVQIVARLRIILHTIPRNETLFEEALAILLFLREKDPALYASVCQQKADPENVLKVLGFSEELVCEISSSSELQSALTEAMIIRGLSELKMLTPRLEKYRELAQQEPPSGGRASHIVSLIENGFMPAPPYGPGIGFAATINRLALTKPFLTDFD